MTNISSCEDVVHRIDHHRQGNMARQQLVAFGPTRECVAEAVMLIGRTVRERGQRLHEIEDQEEDEDDAKEVSTQQREEGPLQRVISAVTRCVSSPK